MPDHSFARTWNTVAELAPDNLAVVCGKRRATYRELHERAAALARAFADAGLVPGDKVAIELINGIEYIESFYGALLAGCVPVNVNYRYVGSELAYLLDNSDARALVFHDDFATTVGEALAALPPGRQPALLLRVAHTGANDPVAGARDYDEELARHAAAVDGSTAGSGLAHEPSGDDLIFIYTGGTTGSPKAVMWRNDDLYRALWQMARPGTEPPDVADTLGRGRRAATVLPACPLMHGTGLFIALSTLSGGGKVVLVDSARLDPERTWHEVTREQVEALTIVGDAFARPLVDDLDAHPGAYDLSSLRAITSSGVTWSPECKHAMMAHLPGVTLIDSLGASEGVMTRNVARSGGDIAPARFAVSARVAVIADDDTFVQPGDERVGMLGVTGPIPVGYYKDPDKTAQTFRTVGGVRYSIPGDYATVGDDGTITLLGRGSACINTGGEKVYPEEVELVVRSHPAIDDCVVVGVPDTRWGEMVVALVAVRAAVNDGELREHARQGLAGYKVPKHFVVMDSLQRSPAGKADYTLLRGLAAARLEELST
ncbi:MAG TPA: AMP-binding protein [Acidimicrobiia bacterium]